MKTRFLTKFIIVLLIATLAGCGGSNSTTPAADSSTVHILDQNIVGYWTTSNANEPAYEFYAGPTEPPYSSSTDKVGKISQNGVVTARFLWDYQSDGSVKLKTVSPFCPAHPLSQCPVNGTVVVSARNDASGSVFWNISYDDNNDGVVDRQFTRTYSQKTIDWSSMPQGQFFLAGTPSFDTPLSGSISNGTASIRMVDFSAPVTLTAPIASTPQSNLVFSAGQSTAITDSGQFGLKDGSTITLPFLAWYDNVRLTMSADNTVALNYELHRKVQVPANFDATTLVLGNFERTTPKSMALEVITTFVPGVRLQPQQNYYSFLPLFNPDWTLLGGGNQITLTSSTAGTVGHTDIHGGKYSESYPFTWSQGVDGSVVFSLPFFDVKMQFIKPVPGGYQVLYSYPDPVLGVNYLIHDLVLDSSNTITAADLPGTYAFTSSDSYTPDIVVFHRDGTVSGVVGGYWFIDTNGDLVSYECKDVNGTALTTYAACYASFDQLANSSLSHIRRVKMIRAGGNDFQVKYDSIIYGDKYGITGRDYITAAVTYHFVRLGDENFVVH
ncbi:MAG TPA: hypothetical protein VF450_21995 [Noviherbaspirillum sp.]